jgi:hypothetical protein
MWLVQLKVHLAERGENFCARDHFAPKCYTEPRRNTRFPSWGADRCICDIGSYALRVSILNITLERVVTARSTTYFQYDN